MMGAKELLLAALLVSAAQLDAGTTDNTIDPGDALTIDNNPPAPQCGAGTIDKTPAPGAQGEAGAIDNNTIDPAPQGDAATIDETLDKLISASDADLFVFALIRTETEWMAFDTKGTVEFDIKIDGTTETKSGEGDQCTYDAVSSSPIKANFTAVGKCGIRDPQPASREELERDFMARFTFTYAGDSSKKFTLVPDKLLYFASTCTKVWKYFGTTMICPFQGSGIQLTVLDNNDMQFDLPDCKCFSDMKIVVKPDTDKITSVNKPGADGPSYCKFFYNATLTAQYGGEAVSQEFVGLGALNGNCQSPFPGTVTMEDVQLMTLLFRGLASNCRADTLVWNDDLFRELALL